MLTYLVTFQANEEKCENYHQNRESSKIKIVRMLLFNNKESRNYEVLTTLKR